MKNIKGRRDFIKISGSALAGIALTGLGLSNEVFGQNNNEEKEISLGFVGIGDRGSYHLDCSLGIPGVKVTALCDINNTNLYRAKKWVEDSGQPAPTLYNKGETDFIRMCENEELDAIICCTSWKWHAPICIAAMKNGKHAVCEVPIVLTVEEAWEIVETYEKTGKWATLALEQVLLELFDGLTILNMIRNNVFGEILHIEAGYLHDLRLQKFDPEREPWRLQHSVNRNGNLYPDHPMNRIMPYMNINHGDRFDYLVSMSSKSIMLNEYASRNYGKEHPYASKPMAQGDYNSSLIRTVNGNMVTLNFDTNTPHPRGLFRMQGSKGVFTDGRGLGGPKIYLEGVSPDEHQWESVEKYLDDYMHPLIKNYNPPERKAIRGHGAKDTKTPLTWHLLIKALREDSMPYFDVYDSVTSSVISPLTELSIANKSKPVEFPDFTKGKWKSNPPIKF